MKYFIEAIIQVIIIGLFFVSFQVQDFWLGVIVAIIGFAIWDKYYEFKI